MLRRTCRLPCVARSNDAVIQGFCDAVSAARQRYPLDANVRNALEAVTPSVVRLAEELRRVAPSEGRASGKAHLAHAVEKAEHARVLRELAGARAAESAANSELQVAMDELADVRRTAHALQVRAGSEAGEWEAAMGKYVAVLAVLASITAAALMCAPSPLRIGPSPVAAEAQREPVDPLQAWLEATCRLYDAMVAWLAIAARAAARAVSEQHWLAIVRV